MNKKQASTTTIRTMSSTTSSRTLSVDTIATFISVAGFLLTGGVLAFSFANSDSCKVPGIFDNIKLYVAANVFAENMVMFDDDIEKQQD
jgi:hypothetical protein